MIHDSTECFFNTRAEEEFLFSLLKKHMMTLEWGSGASTKAIAERVCWHRAIEHDLEWYKKVEQNSPFNTTIYHVPANKQEQRGSDGTKEEYLDYIDYPNKIEHVGFDLILIDGRARVECAREAVKHLDEGGSILIHDIFNPDAKCDRPEYWEVLDFLHPVAGEYALWQFKPKFNL